MCGTLMPHTAAATLPLGSPRLLLATLTVELLHAGSRSELVVQGIEGLGAWSLGTRTNDVSVSANGFSVECFAYIFSNVLFYLPKWLI